MTIAEMEPKVPAIARTKSARIRCLVRGSIFILGKRESECTDSEDEQEDCEGEQEQYSAHGCQGVLLFFLEFPVHRFVHQRMLFPLPDRLDDGPNRNGEQNT